MPSVSLPQHNAMEAAAHGHSTLGIPRSVGLEFSHADRGAHFPVPKVHTPGKRSAALAALRALRTVPRADPMRRGSSIAELLRTGGAPGPGSPFGVPR